MDCRKHRLYPNVIFNLLGRNIVLMDSTTAIIFGQAAQISVHP